MHCNQASILSGVCIALEGNHKVLSVEACGHPAAGDWLCKGSGPCYLVCAQARVSKADV